MFAFPWVPFRRARDFRTATRSRSDPPPLPTVGEPTRTVLGPVDPEVRVTNRLDRQDQRQFHTRSAAAINHRYRAANPAATAGVPGITIAERTAAQSGCGSLSARGTGEQAGTRRRCSAASPAIRAQAAHHAGDSANAARSPSNVSSATRTSVLNTARSASPHRTNTFTPCPSRSVRIRSTRSMSDRVTGGETTPSLRYRGAAAGPTGRAR